MISARFTTLLHFRFCLKTISISQVDIYALFGNIQNMFHIMRGQNFFFEYSAALFCFGEHLKSPTLKSSIPNIFCNILFYYHIFRLFSPDLNYTPISNKTPNLYFSSFLKKIPHHHYIAF